MSLETMTKLATVTVGVGGQASINFTNIPQGYTDLHFLLSVRSTGNYGGTDTMVDDMRLTFNGSSGANYTSIRLAGDGSSASSTAFTSQTIMNRFYINGSGATTSTFGSTSIYVANYASSTNKSLSADTVGENNATKAWMNMLAGLWNDPSPITSTSFSLVNGNFAEHSTATLYGIKNAQRTAGNSIKATGGNIVFDGTYVTHTFNSSGVFTPTQPLLADCLLIAGGGGGGFGSNATRASGGGGAGGLLYTATQALTVQNYTITVGAGGTGGVNSGGVIPTQGVSSTMTSFTSPTGGGFGGSHGVNNAGNGGSGGGGGDNNNAGTGISGQGNNGAGGSGFGTGGGGGGAGAVGSAPIGGAGATYFGSTYARGGDGGNTTDGAGTSGATNTANGGNGGRGVTNGGAGGSGVVIIRYRG